MWRLRWGLGRLWVGREREGGLWRGREAEGGHSTGLVCTRERRVKRGACKGSRINRVGWRQENMWSDVEGLGGISICKQRVKDG